jgi:hypothetical protein
MLHPFLFKTYLFYLFIYLFIYAVLGSELKAYTLCHSTSPFFVMVFSKIGSCKLYVWSGFE